MTNYLIKIVATLTLSFQFLAHAEESQPVDADKFFIRGDGILANIRQYEGKLSFRGDVTGLRVLNSDGSLYAEFFWDKKEDEPYAVIRGIRTHPKMWGFYPDYGMVMFDAKPTRDGGHDVWMDGAWRRVAKSKLVFFDLASFLVKKKAGFILIEGTTMSVSQRKAGGRVVHIRDSEDYSFTFLKIEGEWAYVECDVMCEGCGKKRVNGWVRWRDGNRVLVDLRYLC